MGADFVKITFQTEQSAQTAVRTARQSHMKETGRTGVAREAAAFGKAQGLIGSGSSKKTLLELQQAAKSCDVSLQRDYMTVLSHTVSEEDYAKMQEEGFSFGELDPETAVTILDKIKAELVRAGKHIVGYTDDLKLETLAEAVGSDSLARAISKSFEETDIPLTEENIESVKQAWNMASQLSHMEEGSRKYMVDNGLEPEIWNLYLAQNSGAGSGTPSSARYYAEEIKGYYAVSAGEQTKGAAGRGPSANRAQAIAEEEKLLQGREDTDRGLSEQIDRIIEKAGMPVNEKNKRMGTWLVENNLPVTEESLQQLSRLQEVSLPVTEEAFADAAAHALASGRDAVYGNLAREAGAEGADASLEEGVYPGKCGETIYEKAVRILDAYQKTENSLSGVSEGGKLEARRLLEEIRLRMTAEVNVKLLKSGFSIDTAPMEELLEALKEAEGQLAKQYFPEDEQALLKWKQYHTANDIFKELPGFPARILGMPAAGGTLAEFAAQGKALQASYEKAGERYETLMTVPRKDLGDSIRKAFANVDDILEDLGFALTEENRRGARILGYNRMEMTAEHLEQVKEADRRVRFVTEKMTPASTLKMIREGVNPLEKTMEELSEYFEGLSPEYQESAESYSRFLYGLEKNKSITESERESYIGIYRLLHQIEKSDGAAVGALVNSGVELTMKNLLSAVRSGKFKGMDVKASSRLGEVAERITRGESISEQIARAFAKEARELMTNVSYTEEAAQEYRQAELEQLRQTVYSEAECLALLQKGEAPASAANLMAVRELLREGSVFSQRRKERIKGLEETLQRVSREQESLVEKLDDGEAFAEAYEKETLEAGEAVEKLTWEAKESADVKELKLMRKQLFLSGSFAKKEEYFLPVSVGEELIGVRLRVESGTGTSGRVQVTVTDAKEGRIYGDFTLTGEKITASILGNEETEVTKLGEIADTFTEAANEFWTVEQIAVGESTGPLQGEKPVEEAVSGPKNTSLYRIAKIFIQAVKQQERGSYEN